MNMHLFKYTAPSISLLNLQGLCSGVDMNHFKVTYAVEPNALPSGTIVSQLMEVYLYVHDELDPCIGPQSLCVSVCVCDYE